MAKKKLTEKQAAFVREYIVDLNATQAAIRSGYSKKTAASIGQGNLIKPDIAEAVAAAIKKRADKVEINSDYVLKRLAEIDQMDAADIHNQDGTIKPILDWPKVWRQSISGIDISELYEGGADQKTLAGVVKKIKWPDTLRNLELMGRHVDVKAFADDSNSTNEDMAGALKTLADKLPG